MSSILTNTSAMVALQTMKSINKNMAMTQSEISTGKSVSTSKDNAAVWAISKVMESDVKGFKGISDSLALGNSTVGVARKASETITDLLTQVKGKIVAAQEENVDRAKIQTDIEALRDQIASVTGAAQFNGLNMIKGTDDMNVLSSLDRDGATSVSASQITISRQDLSVDAGKYGSTAIAGGVAAYATINATDPTSGDTTTAATGRNATLTFATTAVLGDTAQITLGGSTINYTAAATDTAETRAAYFTSAINALGLEGVTAANTLGVLTISNTNAFETVDLTAAATGTGTLVVSTVNGAAATSATSGTIEQRAETVDFSTTATVSEGDGFKVTVGSQSFDYVAGKNETMEDVAKGLKTAIDNELPTGVTTKVTQDETSGQWKLSIDDDTGGRTLSLNATSGGTASGGLFGLDNIDVTSTAGANAALSNVETMIDTAIDAAAAFGSAQGRLDTQADFISELTDSLKAGIGSLVDADLEETSARLQALQVQQQLATQSLSIANQAPQNLLSLFR